MNNAENRSEKQYAALYFALGVARGVLYDMVDGQITETDVRRVLEATALSRIAESIGVTESDLATDWNDYLSADEKLRIQGDQNTAPVTKPNRSPTMGSGDSMGLGGPPSEN